MMQAKRTGFTLVELLVVIGIIAVLISLLLPALTRSRDSAMQQVCASNLRQLAIAAYCYASDSKGYCVPSAITLLGTDTMNGVKGTAYLSWDYEQVYSLGTSIYSFQRGYLGPYVKTDKIIQCPAFSVYNLPVVTVPETYGITQLNAVKIVQITQTSETPIFADAINYNSHTGLGRPTQIMRPDQYVSVFDVFQGRHTSRGIGNVAFYDGHVDAVVVQVRPGNTYTSPPAPSALYSAQQLHLGPLYGKAIDFTQIPSASAYSADCINTFDYYFWINKLNQTLN